MEGAKDRQMSEKVRDRREGGGDTEREGKERDRREREIKRGGKERGE